MSDQEHHEHEEGKFKVTDRRLFTSDGQLREQPKEDPAPRAAAPTPPAPEPEPRPAPVAAPAPEPPKEPEDDGDPTFERIILSLTQSAMMQLGLVALDPGQPMEPDLMGARETIDMLIVLEKKTRGNLNPREKRLVTETLSELQLAYVGVQRQMVRPPRPGPQ